MYVHHKGTYPVFDFFNYYWSKRDTCTYLFPGFQLAVRNYVRSIDYLLNYIKMSIYNLYVFMGTSREAFVFICVKSCVLQNAY
jgi:hypothetical protein